MGQHDALIGQFGRLGFVTQQRLLGVLRSVEPEGGLQPFMEHVKALWAPDMMGWERVEVATVLANLPASWRATFVVAVQAVGAQALLRLRWAPERVGAHAVRAVVNATALIDPRLWANWVPTVQRACAGVEYYDAPYVVNALAGMAPADWGAFLSTVESLCPENLDSHNRTQIVVMLAQSKLVEERRARLVEACEPLRAGNAFALRATIENFLGAA